MPVRGLKYIFLGNLARCSVAQVTLEPSDDGSVHFVPHWEHDALDFASLAEFTRALKAR